MAVNPITFSFNNVNSAGDATASSSTPTTAQSQKSFSDTLKSALNTVNESQQSADNLVANMANGTSSTDLHNVMIAMQKADVLLKTTVQVRDRVVEAYQEVMRMQV